MGEWLLANKEYFESLAALATAFALLFQLPAFLIGRYLADRNKRRDEANAYIRHMLDSDWKEEGRAVLKKLNQSQSFDPSVLTDVERDRLFKFMNEYEFLSLRIRHKQIDEAQVKRWMHLQTIHDWEVAAPLIMELQADRPSLFVEWTSLVKRWQAPT